MKVKTYLTLDDWAIPLEVRYIDYAREERVIYVSIFCFAFRFSWEWNT